MILNGLWETLYMTLTATSFAYLLGLPLGMLLVVTRRQHIAPLHSLNATLDVLVNILRSVPFLILMVAVIPLTRLVMGRAIGTKGTIMPLVIASFPYVARTVESSLLEIDAGVIEAAQAMGASRLQIMWKVMLREAVPGLINGAAIATTTILSYSAMAGAIGGGGLGALAITYGYNRNKPDVLWATIVALVLLVQAIQYIGTRASRLSDHRQK
jgi:D-methionine transport system permease protein